MKKTGRQIAAALAAVIFACIGWWGAFALLFAVVWGLQIPTRAGVYVSIGVGALQVVCAAGAWWGIRSVIRSTSPLAAAVTGSCVGAFAMAMTWQYHLITGTSL